ncbi:DUF2252 family protein [Bradyrhizobium sp. 31Argb]|uniref:DUF2252 family protein n=1 Tax=unclassified Bradyrhizobium TaxID=2631580 RepID=UPI00102E60D6|nr:DUF2252 family protein [Bradyrhizobium sp. Leo170]TAI60898.1 hypothetical protein CWO89_38125 [Bradyrhizobium sp. Leo170]
MSFRDDNREFEKWLATQCDIVKSDIDYKHERMKESAFIFLRATYFRWARKIGDWCPELMDAPKVLAVGDLHLENFGTWRDADGRLVWGVNDFDEAAEMPYLLDLVRLATSIQLAPRSAVDDEDAASTLLKAYHEGLKYPRPALLFENRTWLRPYAEPDDGEAEEFWDDIEKYRKPRPRPREVEKVLEASLPKDATDIRLCQIFKKGGGSLGRPRYAVIAKWREGLVVREAKALVPSAWTWAHDATTSKKSNFLKSANGRYRSPDPFLTVHKKFIFRRISADSKKIELGKSAGRKLHLKLLHAMAFDVASIHAASPAGRQAIEADLRKRPRGWLQAAATVANGKVRRDYRQWRG